HGDPKAVPDRAEPVRVGDADLVKDQLARIGRAQTELPMDRLTPVGLFVPFEEERGDALVLLRRIGLGEDEREVRDRAVADPRLPPAQHPCIAVAPRGGPDHGRLAPDLRLGDAEPADELAFPAARAAAALLL